jgi:hypothetical protein
MTPACFRDNQQYSEWLRLARYAREACTICEDCKPHYEEEMKTQGRCHKGWYSVQIVMAGKALPLLPPQFKVTKEIEHEKLYWEFIQVEEVGSDHQPSGSGFNQTDSPAPHASNP